MKAHDIAAPQIGLIVHLPETEDSYAMIGRLDCVMIGPSGKITLTVGGSDVQVEDTADIDLITPTEWSRA